MELLMFRTLLILALTALLHAARNVSKKGTNSRGKVVRLRLDGSERNHQVLSSPVAGISLSPWTYSTSWDPSRLPQRISNAHCLTSDCLSLQGGEDAVLEARPIQYQILVLHRVPMKRRKGRKGSKAKKKYMFRLGTEVITVGCTCERPTILPQQ